MRLGFYPRLALDGIRKTGACICPFILTSSIMAAIFYILLFLQQSRTVLAMEGGKNVAVMSDSSHSHSRVLVHFSFLHKFLSYTKKEKRV